MTEKEYRKRFGYWLKRIMIERSMSQTELAKRIGSTQCCISQYIHAKRTPTSYTLMKICEELKCSYTILGCPNPVPPTDEP